MLLDDRLARGLDTPMSRPRDWFSRLLAPGSFARNAAVLGSGTALSQLIALAAYPFLTRLYTTDQFGVLTVYSSALAILVVVASFRYELAIPLSEEDGEGFDTLVLSLAILLGFSSLTAVVVVAMPDQIATVLGSDGVRPYLWLLPIGVLGAGLFQALSFWAIRVGSFTSIARAKVFQGFGLAGTQLIAGVVSGATAWLVVGDVVGRAAGSGRLGSLVLSSDVRGDGVPGWGRLRSVAHRYRRFPAYSMFAGLLNSAGLRVPALLIVAQYGLTTGGQFGLTLLVLAVPITLVSRSVSQVYLSEAARLARTSHGELKRLFQATAVRLAAIGVVPVAVLVIAGPWLFETVFGAEWRVSGELARALSPMLFGQFVVAPLAHTLTVLERQSTQLLWDAIRLGLVVATLGGISAQGGSALLAVSVYGAAMFVAYGLLYVLNSRAIDRASRAEAASS
ncbi:MAG: lipopolysaccharide biosynthesis protein [Acidimicrobiia bacterium]|nr:lipopolysaccharide biosynthesis protein [Acidimicrobiia bacterium]